jgi:hypothetical protein
MMVISSAGASTVSFPDVDVVADLAIIAHEFFLRKCMHAPYDTAHETTVLIYVMYLANFPAILSLAWVLITSINNLYRKRRPHFKKLSH